MPAVPYRGPAGNFYWYDIVLEQQNRPNISCANFKTSLLTLNSLFLHEKLFDYIDIVIAPVLIGGKDTPTLIDGKSLLSESELSKIGVLKLQECMVLKKSYLRLRYKVIH